MSKIWEKLIRPVMFSLDAERAHELGIRTLKLGLAEKLGLGGTVNGAGTGFGDLRRFGLNFANPLGLAAGFDKNGVVVDQLAGLGFGFVEVGTVTFNPQPGNLRPRLFRLPDDRALINRLGFNNDGALAVARRLRNIKRTCIVGVNIGRNKDVPNEGATENYLDCLEAIHPVADYVAVNISSPNTPGLRELQKADNLEYLVRKLQERNQDLSSGSSLQTDEKRPVEGGTQNLKPLLVKIAPDLTEAEIEAVVDICLRHKVAGIIATNTTIRREGLRTADVGRLGEGGLSGKPLTKSSTEVVASIYRYSKGSIPIIGVGGIFDAHDAFDKIAAGASLVQAYTGFVYGGPEFASRTCAGLSRILSEKGFADLDQAVGSAAGK